MDRDQAIKLMQDLLRRVTEKKASDLFITAGFPPAIKIDGGKPAVMNRSEAFFSTTRRSRSCMSLMA